MFWDVLESRRLMSADLPPAGGGGGGDDNGGTDDSNIATTMAAAPNPSLRGGKLSYRGTAGNDTVNVTTEAGNKIALTINGTKTTFDFTKVRQIEIRTEGGNDTVTVTLPLTNTRMPVVVRGGDGNDALTSNFPAFLDGGNGNDQLTGSVLGDKLVGGQGDDTIRSNGGRDIFSAGPGKNRVTYANGDVDVGDLKLRTNAAGQLTITGSRGNDRFVFNREGTTGSVVRVTLGDQTATFDLSKAKALRIDGGAGRDEIVQPAGLFTPTGLLGNKPFSKRSIEVG